MRNIFAADEVDAVLLIDADNAFNRLNRHAILHNIQYICAVFKYAIINTYRVPSRIFVLGGLVIFSLEGTTQGCPFAMAMYALALVPLVNQLHGICKQVWFADDGTEQISLAHCASGGTCFWRRDQPMDTSPNRPKHGL